MIESISLLVSANSSWVVVLGNMSPDGHIAHEGSICCLYRHDIFIGLILFAWYPSQLQGYGSGVREALFKDLGCRQNPSGEGCMSSSSKTLRDVKGLPDVTYLCVWG